MVTLRPLEQTGDNKGGVLVSLSDSFNVIDSSDVLLEGIAMEVLCTALRLPSGSVLSVFFDVLLETMM